jgi:hypothetical protein
MFGLLSHKKARSAAPRLARPRLEPLEGRDAPGTLTAGVTYGEGRSITLSGTLSGVPTVANQTIQIAGQANGTAVTDANGNYTVTLTATALGDVHVGYDPNTWTTVTLTDTAPTLNDFFGNEGENRVWTFTGTTTYNRSYSDLTVYFGGAPVSIRGESTEVSTDGTYSLGVQLNGTITDNGTASAWVVDAWGLKSNVAYFYVQQTGV